MKKQITRAQARKLLKCETNYQLAVALGCKHQQVYSWRDDEPIPKPRQWQVRAMVAESGRAAGHAEQTHETKGRQNAKPA